jgi:hypothetical protein
MKYNHEYYKRNRKKLIADERARRLARRNRRIEEGEKLRQVYEGYKKNKHGQSICAHKREAYRCAQCGGGGMCSHGSRRYQCRVCSPLGWAKRVLRDLKSNSKARDYAPPVGTPERVLELEKDPTCVLCGEPLNIRPALHHDHETGELIGFSHHACNSAEGIVKRMSVSARDFFIRKVSL